MPDPDALASDGHDPDAHGPLVLDPELLVLAKPDASILGWEPGAIRAVLVARERAYDGVIGIYAWTRADEAARRGQPRVDTAEAAALAARLDEAMNEELERDRDRASGGSPGLDAWMTLAEARDRLNAVTAGVPDAGSLVAQLKKLEDQSRMRSSHPEIVKHRERTIATIKRWLRELAAGEDEQLVALTDEDRAVMKGVSGEHVVRVPLAAAREGRRPLRHPSEETLRRAFATERPLSDDRLADNALITAELVCRLGEEFESKPGTKTAQAVYDYIGELAYITGHDYSSFTTGLAEGIRAVAMDELARWSQRVQMSGGITQTGLARAGGWERGDVRAIILGAQSLLRGPRRPAVSHTAGSTHSKAPVTTTQMLSKLAPVEEVVRLGALLMLSPRHPASTGAREHARVFGIGAPGSSLPFPRPTLGNLHASTPTPWLRAWWESHVAHSPEQALGCLDPEYLTEEMGAGAVVFTPGLLQHADATAWVTELLDAVAARARLSARVVATRRDAEALSVLGASVTASAFRRWIPVDAPWVKRELVEEIFEVPHIAAEGLALSRTGEDLGLAGRISVDIREAYLDTGYPDGGAATRPTTNAYVWSPTRLEIARRNARADARRTEPKK